jgi:predicted PurR-regulated permease PerM
LAVFIILLSGLSLFIALLLFIVPVIIQETRKFADVLPGYVSALHAQLVWLAEKFDVGIPQDWDQVTSLIVERGRKFLPRIADISARAFFSIFESTLHILSTLLHPSSAYLTYLMVFRFYQERNRN